MKNIFFITSNSQWSGSEELWAGSLRRFHAAGYSVAFSVIYDNPIINNLPGKKFNFFNPPTFFFERILLKLKIGRDRGRRVLVDQLMSHKSSLVVISRGNNVEAVEIMLGCIEAGVPYVIINQLIAEVHFLNIDSNNIEHLRVCSEKAVMNYFVSDNNLHLNRRMLGSNMTNCERVFNPCRVRDVSIPNYPIYENKFQIAMVGRIECFHKGHDLLIEVLRQPQWRARCLEVNIYGTGPHMTLLRQMIEAAGLTCVHLRGHVNDIASIWKENEILLMPSRMEGQALSLIEAMWMGRAAIVTDIGGATELIENNVSGFIALSPTIDSLSDAMERAWQKRLDWVEMGIFAKRSIEEKHPADEIEYFNGKIVNLIKSLE